MTAPLRSAFGAPLQGAPGHRPGSSAGTDRPQGRPESGLGPQGGSASGPAKPDLPLPLDRTTFGGVDLHRLKWRCRRGLLENDLIIERFFRRHEETITARQASGLATLMELSDNDLLDLLLARCEPQGAIDTAEVREVLGLLRRRPIVERPHA